MRALMAAGLALLFAAGLPSAATADPTTITTVPGKIEDASPSRVLYRSTGAPSHLVIRHVNDPDTQADDTDENVPLPAGRKLDQFSDDSARLVPGGALFFTHPAASNFSPLLHEWRGGVTTDLGPGVVGSIAVAGDYAIWSATSGNDLTLTRRDIVAGTNVEIATDAGNWRNDVASN